MGTQAGCIANYEELVSLFLSKNIDTEAEYSIGVAYTYHKLVNDCLSKGLYFTALEYYNRALEIFKEKEGENSLSVAYIYHKLEFLHTLRCDYKTATKCYKQVLDILKEVKG